MSRYLWRAVAWLVLACTVLAFLPRLYALMLGRFGDRWLVVAIGVLLALRIIREAVAIISRLAPAISVAQSGSRERVQSSRDGTLTVHIDRLTGEVTIIEAVPQAKPAPVAG